jgi:hypothetical protein
VESAAWRFQHFPQAPLGPPRTRGGRMLMGSDAWHAILRWRDERSSAAAGACGKVFAVDETRCGGQLFENRFQLREGPTDIIGRRTICPAIASPV